ncbi:MAG: ribonucleoside triphosphate reductase, partial [Clostridia bacterium]|nr:ribonucleoside triphosphate reductase [Clostridia bacterium]
VLKKSHAKAVETAEKENNIESTGQDELLLFTTKTCPNCMIAKTQLDRAGIAYRVILADEEPDLCDKFNIMQAPTLVEISGDSFTAYANVSNIIKFIEAKKATA